VMINKGYMESELRKAYKDSVAFTMENRSWNLDSLVTDMGRRMEFFNVPITFTLLNEGAIKLANDRVLSIDAQYLPQRNEDFARLMDDYKNGIYIFKLQELEVWNKIKNDSVYLMQYYDTHKSGYIWPDRVEFGEIFVKSDSLAKVLHKKLLDGAALDSLAGEFTERSNMRGKKGLHSLQDVNLNALYKEANKHPQGSITAPFSIDGGYSIIKVYKKENSRIKTYEEAKPEVLSGYNEQEQKKMEEAYINTLKSRYKPVCVIGPIASYSKLAPTPKSYLFIGAL